MFKPTYVKAPHLCLLLPTAAGDTGIVVSSLSSLQNTVPHAPPVTCDTEASCNLPSRGAGYHGVRYPGKAVASRQSDGTASVSDSEEEEEEEEDSAAKEEEKPLAHSIKIRSDHVAV